MVLICKNTVTQLLNKETVWTCDATETEISVTRLDVLTCYSEEHGKTEKVVVTAKETLQVGNLYFYSRGMDFPSVNRFTPFLVTKITKFDNDNASFPEDRTIIARIFVLSQTPYEETIELYVKTKMCGKNYRAFSQIGFCVPLNSTNLTLFADCAKL